MARTGSGRSPAARPPRSTPGRPRTARPLPPRGPRPEETGGRARLGWRGFRPQLGAARKLHGPAPRRAGGRAGSAGRAEFGNETRATRFRLGCRADGAERCPVGGTTRGVTLIAVLPAVNMILFVLTDDVTTCNVWC